MEAVKTTFAPMLIIKDGVAAVEFYKKAFGAIEVIRFSNPDGTIHVAELSLDGAMFHIRQETIDRGDFDPGTINGKTILLELVVEDPHAVQARAVAAGGKEMQPVTDYEHGMRQGQVKDPFGHVWLIEKKLIDHSKNK